MTNSDIMNIAITQSAIDCSCSPEDFLKEGSTLAVSRPHPDARRYLELPHVCSFVTYGHGLVATAGEGYTEAAERCLRRFTASGSPYRLFETPGAHIVSEEFEPLGGRICFMAEYFLPDVTALAAPKCPLVTKFLDSRDFPPLYTPQWSNALCEKRKELDVLGAGAYHGGKLVALAACSADCQDMWQIGVDVLPTFRRRGLASALTAMLAREIIDRGKVPFYCAAWSNIASVRNAIRSGFRPAWVELTVKRREFVDNMNRKYEENAEI